QDFTRWWGTWPGVGKTAWAGLAGELVPVSVEGQPAELLAADVDEIQHIASEPSVRLLPAFDPYLMGHSNRDHLFAAEHRSRVSRTAGWISAVVLADGRVVATWTHTVAGRTLAMKVKPFRKLAPSTVKGLRAQADALAAALALDAARVAIA
ncbi:MAG TPA: crosslink repair DNA glycosylase YcaQ family protein, partial [Candidatus Dormibacteraeota bacterium]|nr:crosslink repair DNA glycosylase YcaQ family protein [Candidatus Dormibacteraeota bacterium]